MVDIFKALSDNTRMRIISLLSRDKLCVCEIECSLGLTQSNASRHLQALYRAGIIERYRKAQWTYYCINESFQKKEALLWQYIIQQLPLMATFETDQASFEKCRANETLCANKNNPH